MIVILLDGWILGRFMQRSHLIVAIGTGIENGHLLYGLAWGFLPTIIYWGYRFIKNDISFLRIDNNE